MYIYICIDCFFIMNYIYIFYTLAQAYIHIVDDTPIEPTLTHQVSYFEKFNRTSMEYLESAWDIFGPQTPRLRFHFSLVKDVEFFVVQEYPRPFVLLVSEGFFVVHLCLPFFSSKMKLIWHMYHKYTYIYIFIYVWMFIQTLIISELSSSLGG